MKLNTKGFTLIELMVVVVILGVLAALAIPKFMEASVKAKVSEMPIQAAAFETACYSWLTETGDYSGVGTAAANLIYSGDNTSNWFAYAVAGDNVQPTFTATGKAALGGLSGKTATSTVPALSSKPTRTADAEIAKFVANFK
jgi:prepilin-type N-terminal cleavage/methylation domain-containing protein